MAIKLSDNIPVFPDLKDVPAYSGAGGLYAKVKATEDGIEYAAAGGGSGATIAPTNLLPNSGFGSWSNSTLENIGSDLVTNGGFSSDTTGWTSYNSSLASIAGGQSGNCLQITGDGTTAWHAAYQSFSATKGSFYKLIYYYKNGTQGSGKVRVSHTQPTGGGVSNELYDATHTDASWTQYTAIFKANSTGNVYITFMVGAQTVTTTALFDTISLYRIVPACIAADNLGIDGGWWKPNDGMVIYRDDVEIKEGATYSIKCVMDAAGDESIYWKLGGQFGILSQSSHKPFVGREVTLGCWVKTSTASKTRLIISDSASNTNSSYHTGGGSWEWLEVTKTVSSSTTDFYIRLQVGLSNTAYFCQSMLIFGDSIGSGNYQPIPNEIIYFDNPINSNDYFGTAYSTTTNTDISLELDSDLKIPENCRALNITLAGVDSGSASGTAYIYYRVNGGDNVIILQLDGVPNSTLRSDSGWAALEYDGTIDALVMNASGSSTLTPYIRYTGIQLL